MKYILLETKLLKNEKHQTRVSLLLELVSDAYLTANRTRNMWLHYIKYILLILKSTCRKICPSQISLITEAHAFVTCHVGLPLVEIFLNLKKVEFFKTVTVF